MEDKLLTQCLKLLDKKERYSYHSKLKIVQPKIRQHAPKTINKKDIQRFNDHYLNHFMPPIPNFKGVTKIVKHSLGCNDCKKIFSCPYSFKERIQIHIGKGYCDSHKPLLEA